MDKQQEFGQYVAQHRVDRGLTVKAVADAVGISRPYLTQIENGHRFPSDDLAPRLLIALGVSMADFLREMAADTVPPDQLDSLVTLVSGYDVLASMVTPEQLSVLEAAMPSAYQLDSAMANLGGLALTPAPEGWDELSKTDRTLVQRLINRLRKPTQMGLVVGDGDE